jgi:hypothetical protein
MEQFDQAWEYDPELGAEYDEAFGSELESDLDPDVDPEVLYLRLISDEERERFWPEPSWGPLDEDAPEGPGSDDPVGGGLALAEGPRYPGASLLFVDRLAEVELAREIRLSELWGRCRRGPLPMSEFLELAALVGKVEGVPGAPCQDCTMLRRPSGPGHWALGLSGLCRVHLRLRLGGAEIDHAG